VGGGGGGLKGDRGLLSGDGESGESLDPNKSLRVRWGKGTPSSLHDTLPTVSVWWVQGVEVLALVVCWQVGGVVVVVCDRSLCIKGGGSTGRSSGFSGAKHPQMSLDHGSDIDNSRFLVWKYC